MCENRFGPGPSCRSLQHSPRLVGRGWLPLPKNSTPLSVLWASDFGPSCRSFLRLGRKKSWLWAWLCVCVCVAIVVVTLWADNWRWHWSAGRRAVCCRVADRPRTGQLSTHHRRIADSPVWLSEPSAHRALRLSADHSCRHSQTEGNYSLYVVQFWKILLCLEITFEQKRHWNRLVQVSL